MYGIWMHYVSKKLWFSRSFQSVGIKVRNLFWDGSTTKFHTSVINVISVIEKNRWATKRKVSLTAYLEELNISVGISWTQLQREFIALLQTLINRKHLQSISVHAGTLTKIIRDSRNLKFFTKNFFPFFQNILFESRRQFKIVIKLRQIQFNLRLDLSARFYHPID
jgi:hypothetical protein